jgi:hypothetical protein
VHHERRRRDAGAALRVVEAALVALSAREQPCCRRACREFGRRRLRLGARLRRAQEAQASLR